MKLIFILSVLGILLLSWSAVACANPTDSFSSEVLLNRAGIAYDLTDIRVSKNVTLQNDVIIYRSHYNPEVAVALSVNKQLDIKLQIPTKQVQKKLPFVQIKAVGTGDIASLNVDAAKELGWNAKVSGKAFLGNISRDYYSLEKGDIRINLMPEGRTSLERIEGEAVINNATTLTADAKKEIENALFKIGFAGTAVNLQNVTEESKVFELDDLEPSVNVNASTFNFGDAIMTELNWLQDNGVISGLTDADIDNIAKEAKKGAAGYNSRIVFFKGNWQPYSRTGQPLYKSVSGCGEFPLTALPAGAVISLEGAGSGKLKDTSQAQGFEIAMSAIVLILTLIWRKARQ